MKKGFIVSLICVLVLGIGILFLAEQSSTNEAVNKNTGEQAGNLDNGEQSSGQGKGVYDLFIVSPENESVVGGYTIYRVKDGIKTPILREAAKNADSRLYEPVEKVTDELYLLEHRYLYNIKDESKEELSIPLTILNYAQLNPAKNKVAYAGKNESTSLFEIGVLDLNSKTYKTYYTINSADWGNAITEPSLSLSWKNDNILLFDAPQNGAPVIKELDLTSGEVKTVKTNAKSPMSLNNGKGLAYFATDRYLKSDNSEMIIEYNQNKITFPEFRAVKASDSKIYIVGDEELSIANENLEIIEERKIENPWFFLKIEDNGKLTYLKAVIENNVVVDMVKGELNN